MEKEKWQSRSAKLFFAVLVVFIIYVALRYAFGIVVPFLAAFVIAMPLVSLSRYSSSRLGGARKSWGVFYVLVFWLLLLGVILALCRKLLSDAGELFEFLGQHIAQISATIRATIEKTALLFSKIHFLNDIFGDVGADTEEIISALLERISAKGSEIIALGMGKMATFTPRFAIALVVCVISSFYFCKDWESIKDYAVKIIPYRSRDKSKKIILRISSALKSYIRAYARLFLITFCELFVGFWLLGRKYALVCAMLIAALDILPLLGSGIVLVPWAIFLIGSGSVGIGVGMIFLFCVISIARQILEPRLVGKALGIHPLATLASMYIGFRIFGMVGMILAPMAIVVIKEINGLYKAAE